MKKQSTADCLTEQSLSASFAHFYINMNPRLLIFVDQSLPRLVYICLAIEILDDDCPVISEVNHERFDQTRSVSIENYLLDSSHYID